MRGESSDDDTTLPGLFIHPFSYAVLRWAGFHPLTSKLRQYLTTPQLTHLKNFGAAEMSTNQTEL